VSDLYSIIVIGASALPISKPLNSFFAYAFGNENNKIENI
jgi:hypothetical protein